MSDAEWTCEWCGCDPEGHTYEQKARYCYPLVTAEVERLRGVEWALRRDMAYMYERQDRGLDDWREFRKEHDECRAEVERLRARVAELEHLIGYESAAPTTNPPGSTQQLAGPAGGTPPKEPGE